MVDIDPAPLAPSGAKATFEGESRSASVATTAVGSKSPRVLVVDDDMAIRTAITKFLRRSGYEAESFERGSDLLRSLKEQRADLVISDLFMPDTDGMELLIVLRKHAHRPQVIVMSGGNNYWSASLHAAKQLGAVATLMKPFSLGELLDAVRSALAGPAESAPAGKDVAAR